MRDIQCGRFDAVARFGSGGEEGGRRGERRVYGPV